MKKIMLLDAMVMMLVVSVSGSQNYPDTLRVPVTLYDFHSDLSNPEFETIPSANGIWTGMVAETLDAQKKPVLGARPFFNLDIAKWFRPFSSGDVTIPNYGTPEYSVVNAAGLSPAFMTVTYDTAFKNGVFQDTLIFTHGSSAGMYLFDNQNFFPLDGKGFGAEGKSHNFSFTMELHAQFTMEPGLTFQFTGDDDVWAFINNKLVMDIGGRHIPRSGVVTVDSLGLVAGQKYSFDFFYCERHTNSATATINTNIFKPRADSLILSKTPDRDTIISGDSVQFLANVNDKNGALCSLCNQNVTWIVTPSSDRASVYPATGPQTTFKALSAYQAYIIEARYENQTHSIQVLRRDTVYVKPGASDHVVLEANADSMVSLHNDAPIRPAPVVFTSGMLKDSVYAIIRDKYGNWVGRADSVTWLSRDTSVVTVVSGRPEFGEGILMRQNANQDTTIILAATRSFKDSAYAIVNDVAYSQIQIYVISGSAMPIDTLKMRTEQDTSLRARGLRADGSGIWDDLAVSWASSSGMAFTTQAPVSGNKWTFGPTEPSAGLISISYTSQSKLLSDTLYANFPLTTKRTFTAWANDNVDKKTGIDNDDFVLLTFDKAVEIFPVSAANIDSVFPLSNGHSWLSGAGSIGGTQWNADSTRILITLSAQTDPPTISVGDTIACPSVRSKAVLTGSFGLNMSIGAGKRLVLPAELTSVFQSSRGFIFAFSSSVIEGITIRIIDVSGRLVADISSNNLHNIGNNHFCCNNKVNNRPASGIFFAQVFRNSRLLRSVPLPASFQSQ
jgi:fibro-slime domain-containing protein